MPNLINYHVIDPHNVGDLLSSPLRYFPFPGLASTARDLRTLNPDGLPPTLAEDHVILGGGGLLFERFLPTIAALQATPRTGQRIVWGAGQQTYDPQRLGNYRQFDYGPYLANSDLVGVRDDDVPWPWVPCASCMHPAFDQPRTPQHEIVVFSHKKFQLHLPKFPHLTHAETDFETVLNFLGSGETILTSSFHGAYWGTLLGRKVLAFPFSSKFASLRHRPTLYPLKTWSNTRWRLGFRGKTLFELTYKNKYRCATEGWQALLGYTQAYPESLADCRAANQAFYGQVMDRLG